ncbi:LytTR family transcriptional regulator [Flavobacteriaceae bacterium AU392]|nr:LytTR family transcriptional regulator [Flavobacteriaceae bacterium]RKM85884.1 LytTR family transcriptional regulator [Flavobacteriaceae bacterium AU392]
MQLNRSISYTSSWKYTFFIGLILALGLAFVLVFLQPFDTYSNKMPYKELKLSGYSICVLIPVLILHVFEEFWFKKNKRKWFLINEIVSLSLGFVFICIVCYVYNYTVVNDVIFNFDDFYDWLISFALPFVPIFIPIWVYLRYRLCKVTIPSKIKPSSKLIVIKGTNSNEVIEFQSSSFVMAKSQANYVDVYILNKNGELEKHILRNTLSALISQIPRASQVHRSFLINTDYVRNLQGNTRKGAVILNYVSGVIPVSPKHFTALKIHLQNNPKTSK